MGNKKDEITDRYIKGYITNSQLERYKNLGVITEEEYENIKQLKNK